MVVTPISSSMKNNIRISLALGSLLLLTSACAPYGKSAYSTVDQSSTANGDLGAGAGDATGSGPTAPPTAQDGTANGTANGTSKSVPPFNSLPEGPAKFSHPWSNTQTSIVIDAYSGNSIDWKKMSSDPRMAGVIHRSSIGLQGDSQYASRRKLAKSYGLLWGAYHLGRSGDPVAQAKFFLKVIGDDPEAMMFLDLEDTSSSSMMNIPNAVKFMQYVVQATGRIPVVYANDSVTKALNAALGSDPIFTKSRLWYARFVQTIQSFPKGIWQTYFLWQFSSEINCSRTGACLYNVAGTSSDMDINVFYGSKEALASQWK